jgi:hypothetical protein
MTENEMPENGKPAPFITDFATGIKIPLVGPEENRQAVEKFLVNDRGYEKNDMEIDVPLSFVVKNEPCQSRIDLIVTVGDTRFMLIKCVAGSLGSWEREALSAARLADIYQIPFTLVADGKTATVLDTVTGKTLGKTIAEVPSKDFARQYLTDFTPKPFPAERLEKERLIFRTYDTMNVNTIRGD